MTNYLNFFETPRIVGNPFQLVANSKKQISDFIEANNGKLPVFVSHNSYPEMNGLTPIRVNVSKLFFDLDSPKIENALLDLRKIDEFYDKENIPRVDVFSGEKGFHIYTILKPEKYMNGTFLKTATRAIQLWIKSQLNLRTIDTVCTDPTRLCRVLYSKHCSTKNNQPKLNGRHCTPLLPEWVHTWSVEEILTYSQSPTILDYNPVQHEDWNAKLLTLSQFIENFSIDIEEVLSNQMSCTESTLLEYKEINDTFLKQIIPRPCIHYQIAKNPNPPHIVRFAATVQLKSLGYSRQWIFDFFQNRNYADKHRTAVCAYQINHIYDHSPAYKHPSCETLYNYGLCIGKTCPYYHR